MCRSYCSARAVHGPLGPFEVDRLAAQEASEDLHVFVGVAPGMVVRQSENVSDERLVCGSDPERETGSSIASTAELPAVCLQQWMTRVGLQHRGAELDVGGITPGDRHGDDGVTGDSAHIPERAGIRRLRLALLARRPARLSERRRLGQCALTLPWFRAVRSYNVLRPRTRVVQGGHMGTEAELEALRRDVHYLKDRQAIFDCIAAHARGCDRHDADMLTNTYHDDGVDEHGTTINSGPQYAAWANAVHAATSSNHLHNVTTHLCEIEGDEAHAESYVLVTMLQPDNTMATVMCGRYLRPTRAAPRNMADRPPPIHRRTCVHRRRLAPRFEVLHQPGLPARYTQPRRRLIPSTPDTRRPRRVLVTRHAPHELHRRARPAPKLPDGRRRSGREPAQIPRTDRQSTSATNSAISGESACAAS